MPFNVKKRGKLTYYSTGDRPTLSALVTEELPDGDLKISFAGLTGGYSAKTVLGLDELITMDPKREVPLVFRSWEKWLQDAGICQSLREIDFVEVHAFGCQPKSPNPAVDPAGFAAFAATIAAPDIHDIVTVAWSPLGPRTDLLDEQILTTIAAKYGKTPAQVVLRWDIELGIVPIPRFT